MVVSRFSIKGHKNVLSHHKSTLEFTKDEHLTKKGDCILGVEASFNPDDFEKIGYGKTRIDIGYGKIRDSFSGYTNENFSKDDCMVIRRSSFLDQRTLMVKSNKISKDIDRRIITGLKNPKNSAEVIISNIKIKNIVFDFDDTLEIWHENEEKADDVICRHIAKDESTYNKLRRAFSEAKGKYIRKRWAPKFYGRDVWLREAMRSIGISATRQRIDYAVKEYWKSIDSSISLYPGTEEVLERLSENYNLYMLSDSDGYRSLKMRRIKKLGIGRYFKGIYTSDDTGYNKPHTQCYKWLLDKTGIDPHETASVGDHPEADLIRSKEIGMSTVLLKQGPYAETEKNYVDFYLSSIRELPSLLERINRRKIKNTELEQ